MTNLRILHVLDHSLPLQSGYTFRTREILREQHNLGWETFHVTSPKHTAPSAAQERVDGLDFYRSSASSAAWTRIPVLHEMALMQATARRIRDVARVAQPHILHVHSPVLNALPALRVARALGIPMVYEVRAFWEDAAVDHGTSREWGARYRATRALETYAMRRADHVTTICDGLKSDILQRGVPEAGVTVIPNAVNVASFAYDVPSDVALRHELGLDDAFVVGFVGSFYAYEGLDLLLEALPLVLREVPHARVLLVGGGPEEKALKAMARTLGIADKVIFTGRVPHAEVQRHYSIVDVLAYPRRPMRLTELVTPLKPLEAMAQGRLLVASDVGGHRELIRDGETGVLFRAGDAAALAAAIARLFSEPERWPVLREHGRRFVENERSWASSVARYRGVYDSLPGRTARCFGA